MQNRTLKLTLEDIEALDLNGSLCADLAGDHFAISGDQTDLDARHRVSDVAIYSSLLVEPTREDHA